MELKNLLKAQPTEVTAEYLPGFKVTIRYAGLPEIERVLSGRKMFAKGGKLIDEDGSSGATRAVLVRAIQNWQGLTKDVMLQLNLDLDLSALDAFGPTTELPCTDDNKVVLLKNDALFVKWVENIATEIKAMRELEVEEEAKNSQTSQSGLPDPVPGPAESA